MVGMEKKFLPTQPAPLPYKGAPLTVEDIILQQARYDEKFYPPMVVSTPPTMRHELPKLTRTAIVRNMFLGAVSTVRREAISLIKI